MSRSASIALRIIDRSTKSPLSPIRTLQMLVDYGWNLLGADNSVLYLPVGDDDMFDWTCGNMSMKSLMELLTEKELAGELVGVYMSWRDMGIGGDVLLWQESNMIQKNVLVSMSLCIDASRKTLIHESGLEITDVSWYLTRLLPAFNQGDTYVEYYVYDEHI